MATVFHTWQYGRFIEMQSNLRRKKLHRANQGSNFLAGIFSNRDNVRASIQFRRESLIILKDDFSSRTDPTIFTSIAQVLLDWEEALRYPPMEHLSNDHEDHPNQLENSHKLCDEAGHPVLSLWDSQWKLRQQHD